ncbi:MAG TPA: hypothetical protein VGS27_26475 [Candidatus Sulfotelmatobacter sp.]|nr:hypothetical protein [Candidatus Sulfotelmatobacter sp.]
MHPEVNLTKRINTPNGLRYCPVVTSANGRVKPDVLIVDGKEEKHSEGCYHIEWPDAGKRIRLSMSRTERVVVQRIREMRADGLSL